MLLSVQNICATYIVPIREIHVELALPCPKLPYVKLVSFSRGSRFHEFALISNV